MSRKGRRPSLSLFFHIWPSLVLLVDDGVAQNRVSGDSPILGQRYAPPVLHRRNILTQYKDSDEHSALQDYLNKLAIELKNQHDSPVVSSVTMEDPIVHRLRGLYNNLKDHPELMDSRLAVAAHPPAVTEGLDQPIAVAVRDPDSHSEILMRKRTFELPLSECCPSVSEWLPLNTSKDIHDVDVEIFQPAGKEDESQLGAQFFYTTRCVNGVENESCTGVSDLYRSKCMTRHGYVMALIRKKASAAFDWNWIQVPVSCNCAVGQIF